MSCIKRTLPIFFQNSQEPLAPECFLMIFATFLACNFFRKETLVFKNSYLEKNSRRLLLHFTRIRQTIKVLIVKITCCIWFRERKLHVAFDWQRLVVSSVPISFPMSFKFYFATGNCYSCLFFWTHIDIPNSNKCCFKSLEIFVKSVL